MVPFASRTSTPLLPGAPALPFAPGSPGGPFGPGGPCSPSATGSSCTSRGRHISRTRTVPLPDPLVQRTAACAPPRAPHITRRAAAAQVIHLIVSTSSIGLLPHRGRRGDLL